MGVVACLDVIHTALSMLSDQCDYALNARWFEYASLSPTQLSSILWNAVAQLCWRMSVKATYRKMDDQYEISVWTLPQLDTALDVDKDLHEWIVSR